jgi:DNA-binding MarR family transcriptional regulator
MQAAEEQVSETESRRDAGRGVSAQDVPEMAFIELLFFAYRDFVSDPDTALSAYGFGRAHHRVLHFVSRHPGIRVADLLDILKITKQSLGRVLKQLIDEGFIEQVPGAKDRRQRLLYVTQSGLALALKLIDLQSQRIRSALDGLSPDERRGAETFLRSMIEPGDRAEVATLIRR